MAPALQSAKLGFLTWNLSSVVGSVFPDDNFNPLLLVEATSNISDLGSYGKDLIPGDIVFFGKESESDYHGRCEEPGG